MRLRKTLCVEEGIFGNRLFEIFCLMLFMFTRVPVSISFSSIASVILVAEKQPIGSSQLKAQIE